MSSPTLPLEMAEHAIDFLHDDFPALTACALASRVLLPAARFHIWRELTVPVQAQPRHVRMQGLLEILDCNADIAPLVRSLTLRGVLSPHPRDRRREYWDDPAGAMLLWEKFPNLRVLKFVYFKFSMGLHQLLPVAYSLPDLEEIALLDSDAMLPRLYSRPRPSYRESIVALDAPPKLRRLSVSGGSVAWSFLEDLAKVLLEPEMHAPLVALDLSCVINSSDFKFAVRDHTDTLPSQAWAPVIASLRQSLRECTLGLLGDECYPANLANLCDSLKQCPRLESLRIVCNGYPTDTFDYRPFLFIDMLADLLSSPDPLTHSPFPQLEALSLGVLHEDVTIQGCADACTKLASALEDRSRYPVLKRLTVAAKMGTIEEPPREETAAREALLRSCLERVASVGVELEISVA